MKKLTEKVTQILRECPECKDSDELLYMEYLKRAGVAPSEISLERFYKILVYTGIPTIESVGRARRKAQELDENLRGSARKTLRRRQREQEVKRWALNG